MSGQTRLAVRVHARARAERLEWDGSTLQLWVRPEDPWQLSRDELTGVDVRIDGWDIRGRWFGVVVGATPRTGELRRGETIPWRVIAAQLAPREHLGSR